MIYFLGMYLDYARIYMTHPYKMSWMSAIFKNLFISITGKSKFSPSIWYTIQEDIPIISEGIA